MNAMLDPFARPEADDHPVVLVVDDDPDSVALLCRMLEPAGYTVLVAGDAEAALQGLELAVPDAILLDAVMPGMSGFELCRRIKARAELAHVPVVFMTGLADTDSLVEGFAAGGVDYVVKPVREPEVLARLRTHARNARAARLARQAVDLANLGVLLVDRQGRVAWCSPKAAAWLEGLLQGGARVPEQLLRLAVGASVRPAEAYTVRNMGSSGLGETMLLVEPAAGPVAPSRLARAALTARETEVLSWVAKGKTNRDIGQILGLSPRTVNKHLEHIFTKLGVETRAAAAALASRHWTEPD